MKSKQFYEKRERLSKQFDCPNWLNVGALSWEEIEREIARYEESGLSKALIKAKTFALILEKSKIAIDKEDIFQDKLFGGRRMTAQKLKWHKAAQKTYLPKETEEMSRAWKDYGAYRANGDYGHVSPNSKLLLKLGFVGLLERVEQQSQKAGLTKKQAEFYECCKLTLSALITVTKRLAAAIEPYNQENAVALLHIANGKPQNIYEAMQLLVLYFFMHEFVAGARVRTLGRLDVLLYPYYAKDIESGTYTKAEIQEMLRYFLHKFWCAKVGYDLPFCLGGGDENGDEVTSELSYLIVETYDELNVYSPKIHIRVSDKTPESFIKLVLNCIRKGNSSFVFINDRIGIESLRRVGIEEKDARNFVPIGCYEPAVWGVEIGCTGNGAINLVKAVECVFTNGRDWASGELCGVETGKINSFEQFMQAVKTQIAFMTKKAMDFVIGIEKHYAEIYPDALLSCQYDESVKRGLDVYEGGAKYNNSSLYFCSIASLVDSICAVKKLIFEENNYTFAELGDILKNNWKNHEKERRAARNLSEKYGNNNAVADEIAVEMAQFCADLINNKPNGRGGVFKAALFSIDYCFAAGKRTMATPDGRKTGEPLSKNLCASPAMDRSGITSLIRSVTKIDLAEFSTGSVLDVVLHPTAVQGDDGLTAFYGLLKTYFNRGGFAMHGNVFNVDDLRAAQQNPERYETLQVRVCGWNAYFVQLSKDEQDTFIKQAQNVSV